MADQPATVQAEATMTSKKRKCHIISKGISKSQAPEEILVPSLTPSTIILVIDLEGDLGGSSPAPTSGIQAVTSQTATPLITIEDPASEPPPIAPRPPPRQSSQ